MAATDWNSIAKKEHLDSLTVELRRLEDGIREVYSEMLLLQQREQEMRDISGKNENLIECEGLSPGLEYTINLYPFLNALQNRLMHGWLGTR